MTINSIQVISQPPVNTLQVLAPATALAAGPPGPQGLAGGIGIPGQPGGGIQLYGINNQVGTTYSVLSTDAGKLIIFSTQTVAVTATLFSSFGTGWWAVFKNKNVSGLLTLVTSGGPLIDGSASMTIDPQCASVLIFTGANFETFATVDGGTF